jgi:D-glycero-alpha-D-manno-heptose-7-phosphate kinase
MLRPSEGRFVPTGNREGRRAAPEERAGRAVKHACGFPPACPGDASLTVSRQGCTLMTFTPATSEGETELQTIRARAPVRFCDLGGWTDTRIVPSGAVLNFTATLYTHVTLQVGAFSGITIESFDTDEQAHIRDIRQIEYNSVLDLFKAAIKRSGIRRGVRILVRSDAPPGSGLGSSAALGVATMAALAHYLEWHLLPYEVARESQALETEELGLECGVQDQIASAYGGVNFMEVTYPHARVFPVQADLATVSELEDRFVLVYTGRSHFSSEMHEKVIAEYEAGHNRQYFDRLAECGRRGKEALLSGDLGAFAETMNDNWTAQKALHPDITTPEIEALYDRTVAAGAVGFKANGAGGGGTVTILAQRNRDHLVRRAVEELGMTVLPSKIDATGLRVWEVK